MPYYDCTVCSTYPIHCLTSNAFHFQYSCFGLRVFLPAAISITVFSIIAYLYGNRILSGRPYQSETDRRQCIDSHASGSLLITSASLFVSLVWLLHDIYHTRYTPFGQDKEIHNVLVQTFILFDVVTGACCSVVLAPRLRHWSLPASREYDPEVVLLQAGPRTPRAVWRSQRMVKRALISIWMSGFAGVFTGDLVMRLLAAYAFGKVLGDLIESRILTNNSTGSDRGQRNLSTTTNKAPATVPEENR